MVSPSASPRLAALLCLVIALGCRDASSGAPPPQAPRAPQADFVIAAGDSVFWVTSDSGTVQVRGAPLELARIDGRFYEIYVADDDRSYQEALLIGQRVYRRDLISGDSLLVYEDTIVPRLARLYSRLYPDDVRLGPDDEVSDGPRWTATTTMEVADLHGPYLSYSLHADVERGDAPLWHTSRRGVLDLVRGGPAELAAVAGAAAAEVQRRRAVIASAAMDSVRRIGDVRDRARAAALLPSYRLDPASFSITTVDGAPAIAYALSGEGAGEAGHLLELAPIRIGEPGWWRDVAATLPISSADGSRDVWRRTPYEVVVRYDSIGGGARVALRDATSREWAVSRLPTPASRIFWLDAPPVDSVTRRALQRAFDESALYDESIRSASLHERRRGAPTVRGVRHRLPGRDRIALKRHRA